MFKQICFFRKRPDMTADEFMDYYENQHSRLVQRTGVKSSMPNALRYVRRYLTPEKNPVTGEVLDPGYDCIMEIWWTCREEFDAARAILNEPERLRITMEDETQLFATHSNPVCSVVEYDSPVGPEGKVPTVVLRYD